MSAEYHKFDGWMKHSRPMANERAKYEMLLAKQRQPNGELNENEQWNGNSFQVKWHIFQVNIDKFGSLFLPFHVFCVMRKNFRLFIIIMFFLILCHTSLFCIRTFFGRILLIWLFLFACHHISYPGCSHAAGCYFHRWSCSGTKWASDFSVAVCVGVSELVNGA